MILLAQFRSAAERLGAAQAFIEGFAPSTEMLIVGASRDAADDLARHVTARRGATFGIHRYSLIQLAARLALTRIARLSLAPATGLGQEAIAARVSFEATQEGSIRYFAPVARLPGFPRALASTLTELRFAGVNPQSLANLGDPGRDVADFLQRFEVQLQKGGVSDGAELLRIATKAAEDEALEPILRIPMVLLDVKIDSPSHQAFVSAVAARSPSVLATVPAGDEATRLALSAIGRPGESQAAAAPSEKALPGQNSPHPDTGLARLRTHIFSDELPSQTGSREDVVLLSAPGEGRECVEVVRRVLEEAHAGTPFDRMAILLRAPAVYSTLLETALGRAGIPAYFARGAKRPDPSGRAFLALLDCALAGLSARKFSEYLSLAQVPVLDADGGPPTTGPMWMAPEDETLVPADETPASEVGDGIDGQEERALEDSDKVPVIEGTLRAPWRWEELLVESAVIGGRERWSRRLNGLAAEYRLRLEELREEEPDSPRVQRLERNLVDLEHLRRFALPVIERLAALPAGGLWGEWIFALEQLAPLVLRNPRRVLTVLAELRPLAPIGPVALSEVRSVLESPLLNLEERRPAHRYGRVFVGSVEQVRGRVFNVIFIPGLAERIFPQKPREDPILLDELRRRLGQGLQTQNERSQHERLLLRLAVGAATTRLYLSYPRIDVTQARARVASFYALEVQRALAGRLPDPETLELEASAASGARLAWPAPGDPMRAIDEVEHDLATLNSLLRVAPAEARGRARYLLELNEFLARSLRTRWRRWRKPWIPADGIVRLTDATQDALAASRLTLRPYSVSALQKFAVCPYKFFLSAICRLEPREEIVRLERLDALTRGKIFHRIQADLMRALQRTGQLPLSPDKLGTAIALLDETVAVVSEEYREELAPPIQRIWQNEVDALRVDLRMWLERSVETQVIWEPFAFELAFGMPTDPEFDARSTTDEAVLDGDFRLRGVVDLVEKKRGSSELRVTDHKTGKSYTKPNLVLGGGESLQPVLYSLAIERVLREHVVEGRLFYCTRSGEFEERLVEMSQAVRQRGFEALELIDRAITRGFLPPAPRQGACAICDFRDICGPHEELRIRSKDQGALAELTKLRSWP